jgi:hypothetical protein
MAQVPRNTVGSGAVWEGLYGIDDLFGVGSGFCGGVENYYLDGIVR